MKLDDKERIILTRKKAIEIFLLLSNARFKLSGKMQTTAEKYWKEFESVLDLDPNKPYKE